MPSKIEIIHGFSEQELENIADDSIDLVFTSPPYANRRKNTYGGIPEDEYLEWFRPIAVEIKRILKPTGSFFLNIKPHTKNGERSLYVFELVIMLKREIGFYFVEDYCWTKNAFPGDHRGRFKNAFEPVYHFTLDHPSNIVFNPLACAKPIDPGSVARAHRKQSGAPKNGSGMTAMNTTNVRNLKLARPSNVVHVNNISNQNTVIKSQHSATFPEKLVEFFVKSFSNSGSTVLDCFAGSGTTGVVCIDNDRNCILIDKEADNIELIKENVTQRADTNNLVDNDGEYANEFDSIF